MEGLSVYKTIRNQRIKTEIPVKNLENWTEPARISKCVVGLVIAACGILLAETPVAGRPTSDASCYAHNAPPGWKIYLNQVHGFCFSYPPIYARSPLPWLDHRDYVLETTRKSRLFALQDTRYQGAGLLVLFDNRPFDLQSFATYRTDMDPYWGAPSDAEFPPGQMQVGGKTFFYYGSGGGRVCYPDKYYFDLKGKTLRFIFDGPCVDDRTPSPETKKIEAQMLATLRTFQARQ